MSLGDDVYHRKQEMENEGGLDYSCLSKKTGALECCFRHYLKKKRKGKLAVWTFLNEGRSSRAGRSWV